MPAHLYSKFQFLAYHVPTDKRSPVGDPIVTELFTENDLQALKNAVPDADLVSRFTRFMAVVQLAMAHQDVEPDTTTLKIFVAPEFYFRPYATANARSYTEEVKKKFVTYLDGFFQDNRFANWMFVLGTIVSHDDNKELLKTALGAAYNENQLPQGFVNGITAWNTALVVVGTVGVKTFRKTHYSPGDDLDKIYWPKANENASFKDADRKVVKVPMGNFFTNLENANKSSCVFEVQGAGLFGFEICRDHDVGVLRSKGYPEYAKTHANDFCKALVFHVLTSCGMSLRSDKVALKSQGLFALAADGQRVEGDWQNRAEAAYPQSEIQSVMGFTQDQAKDPVMCTWQLDANLDKWNTLNARKETLALPDELKVAPDLGVNNGAAAGTVRPQELAIFKAWEFAAEVDPQLLQQEQQQQQVNNVNNANNNQVQQQVQGGNNQ